MTLNIPRIYLDTNIVIHLADGDFPDINQVFRDGKAIAVYSEATFQDLARSTDRASRMSYLDTISAQRIECNDHGSSKAELIFQSASEYSQTVRKNLKDTSELEESLEEMFLHVAGAKTGLNQKAAFEKLS